MLSYYFTKNFKRYITEIIEKISIFRICCSVTFKLNSKWMDSDLLPDASIMSVLMNYAWMKHFSKHDNFVKLYLFIILYLSNTSLYLIVSCNITLSL